MLRSIFSALGKALAWLVSALMKFINIFIPWHKLPRWLGVVNLWVFRNDLRRHNLHDTSKIDVEEGPAAAEAPPWDPSYSYARTQDGTYNDLSEPKMGAAGTRFGRNFPPQHGWPDEAPKLMTPSPREVSLKLMTRDFFKPAETLNVIAAAWIQFQNHEWFNHQRFDWKGTKPGSPEEAIEVPLADGDDWHENPMRFERTRPDDTRKPGPSDKPPTFRSTETHWWDGSQIYGSTREREQALRSGEGGKLKIEENGLLPLDPKVKGVDLTGFNLNMWVGLSLLHNLFSLEHNAICERLQKEYPRWGDDRLYAAARQINVALMAKIHTVEWTPGILGHPALQIAMDANWWGLVGERLTRALGRLGDSEALSGIPGSAVDHHTAPYYLTEEFVSVYRLHPLIPDDYEIVSMKSDEPLAKVSFDDIQAKNTRPAMEKYAIEDLYYSLGIAHPGAITLHNFPRALQSFQAPGRPKLDLATLDIMRDRERGVPRYNQFRQMLRMPRVRSFRKLTKNREWAQELEALYQGKIDDVDLMVGLYAEPPPKGFGFSDTAFRIFILMASRRLKSDRFFTTDYTPEVYTQAGMDWINENGMKSVLSRHYPALTPAFQNIPNAFAPWQRVGQPG